jgi:hypothetical protein
MTTRFHTLCTIGISHEYYSGRCRDFRLVLPADTIRLLKGGRLLTREIDGLLHLLFEASEADVPRMVIAGRRLRIGLQLLNPDFSNFTAVDADFTSSVRLFRNAPAPAVLTAAGKARLAGRIVNHTITSAVRPATFELLDADENLLETREIPDGDNRDSIWFDLGDHPAGRYTVRESFPAITTVDYYSDAELFALGCVGVIEITIDGGFYSAPPAFVISFTARKEALKYYVVATKDSQVDVNQLSVVDAGFAEDGRPQVAFVPVLPAAFTADELPVSLLGRGDDRVILFKSQTQVARRQQGMKKIELHKNGDILIPSLPQPGAEKTNANMILHISKP